MARIGRTLITKSGWRPCPVCASATEYGAGCTKCSTDADVLIRSAMTPAVRRLVDDTLAAISLELAADARP